MADTDRILRGPRVDETLLTPVKPLGKFYLELLQEHGEAVAQEQQVGERLESRTFSELLLQGKRVAMFLREKGLESGDTVLISCGNNLAYTPIMLGTLFIGATIAPIHPYSDATDMQYMLEMIRPDFVINNDVSVTAMTEAMSKTTEHFASVSIETMIQAMEIGEVNGFELGHVADPADDVALVMCSSGTSGRLKGVEMTHRTICLLTDKNAFRFPGIEQPVIMNMSSPYWISAQAMIMACLFRGAKLVLLENFTEENFLKTVQQFKVNFVMLGPNQLVALAKWQGVEQYDTSSLLFLSYGGAATSRTMVELASKKLRTRLIQGYAMTECLKVLNPLVDPTGREETVGKLDFNVDAKVIDLETGSPLDPDCEGELCFRNPVVMKGYRNNPEATKAAFDKDGFYHSGDVGYYDSEGYFFIKDRIKELIKYIVHQVPAIDIEEVLLTHSGVLEAAVVGIPNERDYEHATAFLVRRPDSSVTEEELVELVKASLPSYKWLPGGVRFLDSIPKTGSGKPLKRKLRELGTSLLNP